MSVRGYLMGIPTDPQAAPTDNNYRWATVTDDSPLEIQLDGDTLPLATVPDCLVDPLTLAPGDRVWVQLYGRRVIVHGAQGGGTGPHTLPLNEVVARAVGDGQSTSSGAYVDWPLTAPLTATITKRDGPAVSELVVDLTTSGYAQVAVGTITWAVLVDNTTDVEVNITVTVINTHMQWNAKQVVTGLAAGVHTLKLRAKTSGPAVSGDINDQYSISIREAAV